MSTKWVNKGFKAQIISMLEKLPIISFYSRTRGWYYMISWGHRIAGILLVILLWIYIYSLTTLCTPSSFNVTVQASRPFIFALFQWILAIPVIFHAFNGGRLILYESFGNRNDEGMIRWVLGLSVLYMALLGLIMLMGDQSISEFLFWIFIFIIALIPAYMVATRIRNTEHSFFWKFQRISGAFLIVMVPAYLLFVQLNPLAGKDASVTIMGMKNFFIKAVYLGLLVGALYHGGYGLWSIVSDYFSSRTIRTGVALLVTLVMLIFAWAGIRLCLAI
ncbi:MAG: hypothetical protein JRJ02_07610 [Deltaproteobacteria bacterium]|nr:hypothetical protein [Deltaproteobacteria bacterium]